MRCRPATPPTSTIPDYGLYGETALPPWYEAFYFERIAQRSGLHNWEIQPHRHNALLQIMYVEKGSGETTIEGARWQLAANCLLLIPAQTVHGNRFAPDIDGPVVTAAQRPLESLASVAKPDLVQMLRKPVLMQVKPHSSDSDALSSLFALLESESQSKAVDHLAAGMALLLALVIHIAR